MAINYKITRLQHVVTLGITTTKIAFLAVIKNGKCDLNFCFALVSINRFTNLHGCGQVFNFGV